MPAATLHRSIFGPCVLGPDGFRFAPHVGEFFTRMRIDGSLAKGDAVRAAADAGAAGGTTFGDRFKASFTKGNIGKGLMQGLGLGFGLGAVGIAAKGVQVVTDAITGAYGAAVGWESAMAGVSKTLDTTGLSSKDAAQALADIGSGLRSMAKEIPVPVEQLAALAEAGGALGIARGDLLEFTKTAAMLGTTTDVAASDAATALGKISAVMPFTRAEYSRFAATLVDLGNKGASTESEIVAMAQNMAGAASVVGLSKSELLAWASAMSNVGEEAEAGGSSFQKFALGINSAVNTGSTRLTDIAEVAGMAADAFRELWASDSSEAMRRVVAGLAEMDDKARQAQLAALGFDDIRITRAFLALTSNVDNLNGSLKVGEQAWKDNTAAVAEAEKRYDTTQSKLDRFGNRIHDVAISAGGGLADIVGGLLDVEDAFEDTFFRSPQQREIDDWVAQLERMPEAAGLGTLALENIARAAQIAGTGLQGAKEELIGLFRWSDAVAEGGTQLVGMVRNFERWSDWLEQGTITAEQFDSKVRAMARGGLQELTDNLDILPPALAEVVRALAAGTTEIADEAAAMDARLRVLLPGAFADWPALMHDYGAEAISQVDWAIAGMFTTLEQAKDPWKQVWRDMARFAKDPFRPKAFEEWLAARAEAARDKAAEAARNGQGKVARHWLALAEVMSTPVLAKLAETEEEIQALVTAMATVMLLEERTGTRRMGSTQKVAGRATGGPVQAGVPFIVGEERPEVFVPDVAGRIVPSVPEFMQELAGPALPTMALPSLSEAGGRWDVEMSGVREVSGTMDHVIGFAPGTLAEMRAAGFDEGLVVSLIDRTIGRALRGASDSAGIGYLVPEGI